MKDEIFDLLSELETYASDTELTRDITEMLTQEFEVNDPSPERAKDVYVRSDRLARVIHDRLYRETETVAGIFNRLWETLVKKKPTEGGAEVHRLQTFYCDKIPREPEIQAAVDLAQTKDCYVEIRWYVPHNGNHSVIITDRDDYESAAEKLPKRCPV